MGIPQIVKKRGRSLHGRQNSKRMAPQPENIQAESVYNRDHNESQYSGRQGIPHES
jgi:hypothetical protein